MEIHNLEMHTIKVRLTFQEEILGTASNNPEIHSEFVASKAPDAKKFKEEVAAIGVEEAIEKSMTVFPRDADGNPILYDYQIKGFFKDACGMLRNVPGTRSNKLTGYKKKIDGLVFVFPRMIHLNIPGNEKGTCERPLRAQTNQGDRVALANSETAPAGTTIEFEIGCLSKDLLPTCREWLDYGILRGIGQWRNSGKGKFLWQEIDDNGEIAGGNVF